VKLTKQTNLSLQELLSSKVEPFQVSGTPTRMAYTVNIDDDFTHPSQFADLVSVLENADEGDHVRISLCTDGGALHSILPLLGAIDMTEAHVHVHAASDVASAGTFLLMKADSVSMNDYVTVMMHEVSFGASGTGSRITDHVAHTLKSSQKIIRDMYQYFFSEDDLGKLLAGKEFYMDREEFIKRYEQRAEMLDAIAEMNEPRGNSCSSCSCKDDKIKIQYVGDEAPTYIDKHPQQLSVEQIKQDIDKALAPKKKRKKA